MESLKAKALEQLRAGDTLVVWRLDRLGRSLKDLILQAESRLGCQARVVSDGDILVEISDESIRAWYDEHPDARKNRDSAA